LCIFGQIKKIFGLSVFRLDVFKKTQNGYSVSLNFLVNLVSVFEPIMKVKKLPKHECFNNCAKPDPLFLVAYKISCRVESLSCGLYYKRVTILIDAHSVVKVTLQIVASLTIVIDDAS
jgi:hypothetical protein